MRRRGLWAICAVALTATACSSTGGSSPDASPENTIVPDDTIVAPGACDPSQLSLPVPQIEIDGKVTDATLGSSSDTCSGLAGTGYITFSYDPVLLDAATGDTVTVTVSRAATAIATTTVTWGGEAFTETSPGTFESAPASRGCDRLTIDLASPLGSATATYGADIRVGGDSVDCAQRNAEPTEEATETAPSFPTDDDSSDTASDNSSVSASTSG